MPTNIDIPTEAIAVNITSNGILPDVALHERNGVWHHESSHSHLILAGTLTILAIVVAMWPFPLPRSFFDLDLRYFIVPGVLWGGFCGLLAYLIRNRFGQNITIDPNKKVITVRDGSARRSRVSRIFDPIAEWLVLPPPHDPIQIPFADVVAIQLVGSGPYQANLVYLANGELIRRNLYQHVLLHQIRRLGEQYAKIGPFDLVSSTR